MILRNEKWALALLALAAVAAAANLGQILLTHVNYRSWQFIGTAEMTGVHDHWSGAVDTIIMPLAVITGVLTLAVALMRHPRVPWWALGLGVALQAATFITSFTLWARWQNELGNGGYVRTPDGSLSDTYLLIMDTHWIRIALIAAYAVLAAGLLLRAALPAARSSVPAQAEA